MCWTCWSWKTDGGIISAGAAGIPYPPTSRNGHGGALDKGDVFHAQNKIFVFWAEVLPLARNSRTFGGDPRKMLTPIKKGRGHGHILRT